MGRGERELFGLEIWRELFPGVDRYEAGTWFKLENATIAGQTGDPTWLSANGKVHPVVLATGTAGPTGFVHPRSSTSPGGGFKHDPHDTGHDPTCRLDRVGWVKFRGFSVSEEMLSGNRRCVEPANSPLIARLGGQSGDL